MAGPRSPDAVVLEAGASAEAVGTTVDAAVSGRLGPSRTPANRGQTTPTAKPIAAMAPTFIHEGRSASADGTMTVGEEPAPRGTTLATISTRSRQNAKTLRFGFRYPRAMAATPATINAQPIQLAHDTASPK